MDNKTSKKYISYIGSVLTIIGVALPVLKLDEGTVSFITYDKTAVLAVVVAVLSAIGGISVYREKFGLARRCAIGTIVGILVSFIDNYLDMSKLHGIDITDIDKLISASGLSWGWIVLFLGSILASYGTTWLRGEEEDNEKYHGDML